MENIATRSSSSRKRSSRRKETASKHTSRISRRSLKTEQAIEQVLKAKTRITRHQFDQLKAHCKSERLLEALEELMSRVEYTEQLEKELDYDESLTSQLFFEKVEEYKQSPYHNPEKLKNYENVLKTTLQTQKARALFIEIDQNSDFLSLEQEIIRLYEIQKKVDKDIKLLNDHQILREFIQSKIENLREQKNFSQFEKSVMNPHIWKKLQALSEWRGILLLDPPLYMVTSNLSRRSRRSSYKSKKL
jgi:pterin-4a-carbinolamine dehydratase